MSTYTCPVVELDIIPHPDADNLEIAVVGGFNCIVGKGEFKSGEKAIYIPIDTQLGENLLEHFAGIRQYFRGKNRDLIKAAKLRGVVSQGLIYDNKSITDAYSLGTDVAEIIGAKKYEAPTRKGFSGTWLEGPKFSFKIERYENHLKSLRLKERITISEKLHGTFSILGWNADYGRIVSSKGVLKQGKRFDVDDPWNDRNIYCKMWNKYGHILYDIFDDYRYSSIYLVGEIVGPKVQDLNYGLDEPEFFLFDIFGSGFHPYSKPTFDTFIEYYHLENRGMKTVPELYRGPWSPELIDEFSDGDSAIGSGIREGIVIKPVEERKDTRTGRVILKSISGDYLTR